MCVCVCVCVCVWRGVTEKFLLRTPNLAKLFESSLYIFACSVGEGESFPQASHKNFAFYSDGCVKCKTTTNKQMQKFVTSMHRT